jgi:RNA polymerase sigma-70 factor, ECF subfamily
MLPPPPPGSPGAAAAFLEARAAWPSVALPHARFAAFLAERSIDEATLSSAAALECFLACAAIDGAPGGAAALAAHFSPLLRAALRKTRISSEEADDVLQKLWTTLLADAGGSGKLEAWQGKGQLLAFLRVSAVRLALKQRRSEGRMPRADEDRLTEEASGLTPELSYLKETYRASFRAAFQESLDSLSSREQLLLRQHLLDGLTIDELGQLHRVHRSTVARWVAAAREALITRTRRRFLADNSMPPEEGEGVMSLVQSRLDETIRRRLMLAG